MKVFWVVAWDDFYPYGRLDNVKETFALEKEAFDYILNLDCALKNSNIRNYDHITVIDVSRYL